MLETLLYEQEDGVAIVTMNRPEVHNAFNHRMQAELHGLWRHLRRNDDVRAIVLTGAGDEAFCAGIDRDETIEESYLANEENRYKMQGKAGPVSTPFMYNDPGVNINPKTNDLWKPIVAAVNGMACGGALYMLGRVGHHHRGRPRDVLRPPRDLRDGGGLRVHPPAAETAPGRGAPDDAARCLGAHVGRAGPPDGPGLRGRAAAELLERALWVAQAIASAPVMAIQGTLRAIWMTHELSRREALSQVSTFVALGTLFDNIAEGQEIFRETVSRPEWRLR